MPSLDEFFAEAIEQADPANMVEDEYKYVRAVEPVIPFKTLTHNLHSTLHGINPNCTFIVCFSFSPAVFPQGCTELQLRLAGSEAPVQTESSLLPADQSEVQEPGGLPR